MSVRHALLALLSEGPKYGLQLRQEFEARTGEVWPLNVGQVYTTLQRLERDGLVESDDPEGEGPQKGFRITAAGGRELADWLQHPTRTWRRRPATSWSSRCWWRLRVPGVDVHELVQVHRRHLVELMQRYTHAEGRSAPSTTSGWRWSSTPSCSAWRPSSAGSTRPTPGWRSLRRPARTPAPAVPPRPGDAARRSGDERRCSSCARCRRSTGRARPRCGRWTRSTWRSTAASWWRSWGRAARARARC